MFSKPIALLALAAPALATVFVTNPTASSTIVAGQATNINWQDDGAAPALPQWGNTRISIYVGNAQQQTALQLVADNVNVATTNSVPFTLDPKIGPNGAVYFVRFESSTAKDPAQPAFPALAFSAKFTASGMSGTFNATVQAQIDGQTSAPLGGPATAATRPTAPATAAVTTSRPATTAAASASKSGAPTASSTAKASGAINIKATSWVGLIFSAAVAAVAF